VTTQAPPSPGGTQRPASRPSWPALLVHRMLCLLQADFRRLPGPLVIASVLTGAAVLFSVRQHPPLELAIAVPLSVLATAPLGVVRRFPGPVIATVLFANLGFLLFARLSWPAVAIACWLAALGISPLLLPCRQAVAVLVLTELVTIVAYVHIVPGRAPWDATVTEAVTALAAWGTGELLRAQRKSAADRAAAAEQLHSLAERDAIARERASIARELHDVVAHHVSMIAVRAATAPYAIAGIPPPGQAAFGEIAEEARIALNELRVVLGVLRAPGGQVEAAPQPRITDVAELARRMAGTGAEIELSTAGCPRPLPGSVELCGYRIVQEALTNAGRHAPGQAVRVELAYTSEALLVTVRNDGGTGTSGGAASGGAAGGAAGTAQAGRAGGGGYHAGFGLTGLRERVAMLGGTFEAGPDAAAGFRVSALLPAASDTTAGRPG
jgi:signal transduction histidine kinase